MLLTSLAQPVAVSQTSLKMAGGEGAGGDGQRKEPYEGNKRNFLDGLESEVLRKPRLNAWGWYAGALHSPRSVKNSKSTRLPKVTT